jgi:RND superfamily putative drug exporter
METAGRAVVFSGTTVAIGLLAMIVLPLPFLRSIGFAGMLIPLVSVIVAITLLPIVLATIGPRLDWPHVRSDDNASRSWTGWARFVVRSRWAAAAAALVVLALLVSAAASLQPGSANLDDLAHKGPAHDGLVALERAGIGAGALEPIEILSDVSHAQDFATATGAVAGVHGAVAPTTPRWQRRGTAIVDVIAHADGSTSAGRDTNDRVRSAAHAVSPTVRVGGVGAENADFVAAIYGSFPAMIAVIAVLTFLLLARAFRSLLLPLKAVILNIISVAAAWGVITLVWQKGYGSSLLWGIDATHSITAWIPLMIFAFLFGLSMDYEVFILSRMREEYDATGSTDVAVIRGIGRTGRLVTSAALILFLAFVSMASGPETDVKVFATGLAAGILLDATIIRALLVPAVVSLFGRWNWWLPERPARLLRVEPSLPRRTPASAEG